MNNIFNRNDVRDIIVKIFFIVFGCFIGAAFLGVYKFFPSYIGVLIALVLAVSVLAILVTERIRYRIKYEHKMDIVTEEVKRSSAAGEDNGILETEDDCVKRLYGAVDTARRKYRRRIKIQHVVIDLINTLAVNIELDNLVDVVLTRLVEETNSNWGVFYLYNTNSDKLELKKSIGLSKNIYREFDVDMGEGFIGMTAVSRTFKVYKNIPKDTVFDNKTFLGRIIPKNIMSVPVCNENELKAVLAFGSMYDFTDEQIEIVSVLRNYMGFAVNNCMVYQRTQRMTKELQFQNQLIQNMNDELEKKVVERTDFLNSIINSIEDYIIISTDKDGYITTWNKGAEKIMGYDAKEVVGRHVSNISSENEKEREVVWRYYETARDEGCFSSYGWQFKKDGTKYFADTTITPIFDKNGDLQGYTNITKDITSTKDLEQKLISEKAYNEKLVENSTRALVYTDRNGIIINYNRLSQSVLAPEGTDMRGKGIFEFFVGGEFVEKNIKRICATAGKGEFVAELLYKHEGYSSIKLTAAATGEDDSENAGVIIYVTAAEGANGNGSE